MVHVTTALVHGNRPFAVIHVQWSAALYIPVQHLSVGIDPV